MTAKIQIAAITTQMMIVAGLMSAPVAFKIYVRI